QALQRLGELERRLGDVNVINYRDPFLNWYVIELSVMERVDFDDLAALASPQEVVTEFYNWLLNRKAINFAVIAPQSDCSLLNSLFGRKELFPSVCLGVDEVRKHLSVLTHLSIQGYRVILSTIAAETSCLSFFRKYRYLPTSISPFLPTDSNPLLV